MTEIVAEISSSSKEQSEGIEQINHAVTQMDKVTQEKCRARRAKRRCRASLAGSGATAYRYGQHVQAERRHGEAMARRERTARAPHERHERRRRVRRVAQRALSPQ